jgi:hypothetical protein
LGISKIKTLGLGEVWRGGGVGVDGGDNNSAATTSQQDEDG